MADSDFMVEGKPKLPTFLNVLTILTFIMCAYELYMAVTNYMNGAENLAKMREGQAKMENAPAWAKNLTGPVVQEVMEKSIANRLPMLIVSLVAISLCVFGAIEMRKLKKQGYWLWLFGELLPIIGSVIFIGGMIFNTFIAFFYIFPIIFIILYTTQRKHLIY